MISGDLSLAEAFAQFGLSGIFLTISWLLWRDTKDERSKRDALADKFVDVVTKNTVAFEASTSSNHDLRDAIEQLSSAVGRLPTK